MYCTNCGALIAENQTYCYVCGTAVSLFNGNVGVVDIPLQQACPPPPERPMKWYKFLVNFLLFFVAGAFAADGVVALTYCSANAGSGLDYIAIKLMFILAGAGDIYLALLAIITRFRLAKYRKDGLVLLLTFCVTVMVLGVFFVAFMMQTAEKLGVAMVSYTAAFIALGLLAIITLAVMVANAVYLSKRSHLFVS